MKAKLLILTALLLVALSVFPAAGAKIAGPIITPYGHTIINPVEPNGPIIVPYEKLAGPIITPYGHKFFEPNGPIIVPYEKLAGPIITPYGPIIVPYDFA